MNTLTLQAGKKYVTRTGAVVGPLVPSDTAMWGREYVLMCLEAPANIFAPTWTAAGRYYVFGGTHRHDLVAEYIEPKVGHAVVVAMLERRAATLERRAEELQSTIEFHTKELAGDAAALLTTQTEITACKAAVAALEQA